MLYSTVWGLFFGDSNGVIVFLMFFLILLMSLRGVFWLLNWVSEVNWDNVGSLPGLRFKAVVGTEFFYQ